MKVIFFGGTFDPPHIAHKEIIDYAIKYFDNIVIIPNKISPCKSKSPIASSLQRKDMLKIMFSKNDVYIDEYEINSKNNNFTFYTIKYLIEKFNTNDIVMIIGEDQYAKINTWYKSDWIMNNVEIICFNRKINTNIKARKNIKFVEFNNVVSSSIIRKKIADNQDVTKFLDKEVYNYIIKNKLYK